MNKYILIVLLSSITFTAFSQKPEDTEVWEPVPPVVNTMGAVPDDATVLFSAATGLKHWVNANGQDAEWTVNGDHFTVKPGTGTIASRESFGSIQLHIEWRSPDQVESSGQGRGNSGVFLMGLYEVQVLDSYDNRTYSNGQAGSLYKQHIPLANATRPPGEWQSYDIFFTAPEFNSDGSLKSPAYVTVVHNGVLIQNHVELKGPTEYIGEPSYEAHDPERPLVLQDHGNLVSFRNIWVRKL
jgi:hypothetical protein